VTPVVRALLIANVIAYFIQQTALGGLVYYFMFFPGAVWQRPWTLVTYMFLHGDLMHIGFNMLALFFFGPRVESVIGSRRFTALYFISGLGGAVLSYFFARDAAILGASAGVFGVTLAYAYFWPHQVIHIWGVLPVKAWLLVVLTGLMAFWSGFGGVSDGTAHFAHLGGYAGAFLFLKYLDRKRKSFKKVATGPTPAADKRVESYKSIDLSRVHEVNREQVNRILDKISKQGIGSLTPDERVFLSNFVPTDDRPSQVH
jgi:membrane associated rhomboid family serine protease